MIFFHSCIIAPLKGTGFLRDIKNIILPSYLTIKRLTLSTHMNPLIEQHNNNFLKYIKNKFNLLLKKDTSVSLLIG